MCLGRLETVSSLRWFKYGLCNLFPFQLAHKPFPQIGYRVNFHTCKILTSSEFEKYELMKGYFIL